VNEVRAASIGEGQREVLPVIRHRFARSFYKMPTVIVALIRGVSQLVAAASGLLLVFGVTYAMEGMTSRLPMSTARELATATAFVLPWTLLFCSGLHDLTEATKRQAIFWAGNVLFLGFVYYWNRYTTDADLTKVAMPILACAAAMVPHFLRRLSFIYPALCALFGLCGVAVLCEDIWTFTTGSSFATPVIAALMVFFPLASITAATLLVIAYFHRGQAPTA
jgi:hypothetical protein